MKPANILKEKYKKITDIGSVHLFILIAKLHDFLKLLNFFKKYVTKTMLALQTKDRILFYRIKKFQKPEKKHLLKI